MSAANQATDFARVRAAIRDIPDFPKPGIIFKDITPILSDPAVFSEVINGLTARYQSMRIDKIAAMEAAGIKVSRSPARIGVTLAEVLRG